MAKRHPKKDLAKAIEAAEADGWVWSKNPGGGHVHSYLACPHCGQRIGIASTPRNSSTAAKDIRRRMRRHQSFHQH